MTASINELKRTTTVLLDDLLDYTAVRNACISLKTLFYIATGFDESLPGHQESIMTNQAAAIGPMAAAFCITDMMRTRVFLLGLRDAIGERLKMNPGKPVTILYAGTGPFASLLTPLTTVFTASELKMILLEINTVSFSYLEKTIQHFNMESFVLDIVKADATTYNIPERFRPDILLTETMQPALMKEPQVNIVANLFKQCPWALLIPESVQVEVALISNIAAPGFTLFPLKNYWCFPRRLHYNWVMSRGTWLFFQKVFHWKLRRSLTLFIQAW